MKPPSATPKSSSTELRGGPFQLLHQAVKFVIILIGPVLAVLHPRADLLHLLYQGVDVLGVAVGVQTVANEGQAVEGGVIGAGLNQDAAVPNVVMDGGAPMGIDPATGLVDANGTTYVKDPASSLVKRSTFDAMDPADQPKILKQNANPGDPQRFNENGVPDPNGEYYLNLELPHWVLRRPRARPGSTACHP